MIRRVLLLIQQAGMLLQMPRSHVRHLGNAFDTIASHSHHVAIIAYCISRMEGLSHEDGMKAVTMGTFHDLAESRTHDLDFVAKHYTKANEEKAVEDTFNGLDFSKDMLNLIEEYEERETLVSQCSKDADSLAQMYHEWVLAWQGNKLAERWFKDNFHDRVPYMYTESAKKLAAEMKESNPQEWWWVDFVDENGGAKDVEKLTGRKKNEK